MKYALGNMLNGAGGLNADQLALDLQFAADKTLTARKGPTPIFTRGSAATLVNSAGLIEYAPENLLLQSETLGTTWTQTNVSISSNVAVAPDGDTTADKIVENTAAAIHGIDQQTTFTAIPYTLSFYAKKDGRIWVRAFISGLASTWFNIDNGTIGTVASGFTASITNAGNGWYRCSITGTASAGTLSSGVRMATADAVNTYLGDGTSGMFIWGVQLEAGSTAKAYNRTTTSAFYGPRFDHDPANPSVCRGLLIEESRTNTFQRSEDFTQAIWTKTNVTVTGDNATSPDGNNTADSIFETAINSGHRIQYGTNITTGTYSASVYVKSVGGRNVNLEFVSGGSGAYANFNLQTAAVALSGVYGTGFTFISASVTNAGNNWFRISLVATTPVSVSQLLIQILDGNNNSYLGDVTKGVQLWGAQLEAGSFPTSYIPTTTASVVRSADVCSITGAAFSGFYNQPEGTLFADARVEAAARSANGFLASLYGAANIEFALRIFGTQNQVIVRDGTARDFTVGVNATNMKVAAAYSSLNNVASMNGGAIATGTAFSLPAMTALSIGLRTGSVQQINGTIAAIRYYKKRLPNAKLQALTV